MDLYKKFKVSKKDHKPGDLLKASREFEKREKMRKEHRKHEKRHEKRKEWTMREDRKYDREHGIKEGSKRDIRLDHERGLKEKRHEKHYKVCSKCGAKMEKRHEKHEKRHEKNWIQGAIKHPGALHRELGVKEGHKIPASRLRAAAKKGGKIGKRARLAETLKGFHKKRPK
ncbi:hypothetical protein M1506_00340 [Patescibacteria group bacterium]|nr:hypothetical protein [Patescibacteria group bacterium]